jgi:hypothetical protein
MIMGSMMKLKTNQNLKKNAKSKIRNQNNEDQS